MNITGLGRRIAAACAAAVLAGASGPAAAQETSWSFTLPASATTSAGIYAADGRLLRTLWRGNTLAAGAHRGSWDGRDDLGRPVAEPRVEMRVLHHTLRYVWEGVYGNSSAAYGGPEVHKAYLPPSSLVLDGERVLYAVGYNEGQPGLHAFPANAPEQHSLPLRSTDPFAAFAMIASDGSRLYWANIGGMSSTSFVGVFELASAAPARFTHGTAVCLTRRANGACYEPQDYPSVVSVETEASRVPTGLAVQRNGRVLAVAHGSVGEVRLFDKLSGERIGRITLPLEARRLNQIAMTPAGDLWVISGRELRRYTRLGAQPTLAARIEGLAAPVAVATHPSDEDEVWVADGGPSQQLKRFDRSGRARGVLGRAGGYAQDPAVASDKLCFQGREGVEQTALLPTGTGAVWVVDYCNNRTLRWRTDTTGGPTSDAQIAYLPGFYSATVDHANPRRVFANFLEFETDPANPDPRGAWRLVRNWLGGLPAALRDNRSFNAGYGGLQTVETLANGRTYGLVRANGRPHIVELPAQGPLRVVRSFAPPPQSVMWPVMYENGDIGHVITGANTQTVLREPLTGFDAAGNPLWGERVVQASVPTLPGTPYHRGTFQPARFPLTGSGLVVFFDPSAQGNEGFHLGAARLGGTGWLWQASPTGPLDGRGAFQTKAVDGTLHYAGNAAWAHGRHIVYGFHGEFYKDLQTGLVGQANQFMHFDESGLFLGQFGQPSTRPSPPTQPGMSGNAFSPTLVRIGERLHLYHNDESSHGGVHRWRIEGWNDVRELRGSAAPGGTIVLR